MLTDRLIGAAVSWGSHQIQKRVPYSPTNPYLEGAFAPVKTETTATRLAIRGSIPRELQGILTKIGPNPTQVENPTIYHWFIGDGMVHGVRMRDSVAEWYRSRWVGTDSVNRRLGRPPAPGPRHGVSDVVNTNLIGHAGSLWALVEAGAVPVELDRDLNTVRHSYFAGPLSRAYTAHPHRDPQTGELHAICYDSLSRNTVRYVVVDPRGFVVRDVAIPIRHGPMIHDCAITTKHVLIFDLPVTFSLGALLHGATFPYRWNPRHPARVGLLPRSGSLVELRWFDVEPCQIFHTVNAYELDDGSVVVDAVVYQRVFDRSRQGLETSQTRLERWRLDSARGRVERKVFSDCKQEFPRCDERRTTQPYRYAYTIGIDVEHIGPQPLYRHDLETGSVLRHDFGPHDVPSEAVFVPRAANAAEDDGWLFSYVYDIEADRSSVVILNARDFDGEPQAVIELPVRVPSPSTGTGSRTRRDATRRAPKVLQRELAQRTQHAGRWHSRVPSRVEILGEATGQTALAFRSHASPSTAPAILLALLLVAGFWLGFVGLVGIEQRLIRSAGQARPAQLSLMIAVGIGLHNLSEGLAIGQSYLQGAAGLTLGLIIGFALHNATEGFGIVGPMVQRGERPSWRTILLLAAIGGGPTFLGTLLGSLWTSPYLSVAVLAMAGGALLYVLKELFAGARREVRQMAIMSAVAAGFIIGWSTELLADTSLSSGNQPQSGSVVDADGDILAIPSHGLGPTLSPAEIASQNESSNEELHERALEPTILPDGTRRYTLTASVFPWALFPE